MLTEMLRTTGPGTHFKLALTSDREQSNCRVLLWAEKRRAGLWAGLLSWNCQLELEVTITNLVKLWQSPSVSDRIM